MLSGCALVMGDMIYCRVNYEVLGDRKIDRLMPDELFLVLYRHLCKPDF